MFSFRIVCLTFYWTPDLVSCTHIVFFSAIFLAVITFQDAFLIQSKNEIVWSHIKIIVFKIFCKNELFINWKFEITFVCRRLWSWACWNVAHFFITVIAFANTYFNIPRMCSVLSTVLFTSYKAIFRGKTIPSPDVFFYVNFQLKNSKGRNSMWNSLQFMIIFRFKYQFSYFSLLWWKSIYFVFDSILSFP